MKQDSAAWKFRTQKFDGIIYSDFEDKFRALSGFHCIHIIYLSKLGKSRVQRFKRCANRSWNEEVIAIWRQLHQAGGSFPNDFEIQLTNLKSTLKWHQFRIHPLPLWCFVSSTLGIAFIQLMNSKSTSKWHQFRIHPMSLWCFASSTSRIASRALHPP